MKFFITLLTFTIIIYTISAQTPSCSYVGSGFSFQSSEYGKISRSSGAAFDEASSLNLLDSGAHISVVISRSTLAVSSDGTIIAQSLSDFAKSVTDSPNTPLWSLRVVSNELQWTVAVTGAPPTNETIVNTPYDFIVSETYKAAPWDLFTANSDDDWIYLALNFDNFEGRAGCALASINPSTPPTDVTPCLGGQSTINYLPSINSTHTAHGDILLGRSFEGDSTWLGAYSEVRLINRHRPPSFISETYNSHMNLDQTSDPAVAAYITFDSDDRSGNSYADVGPYSNDLQIINPQSSPLTLPACSSALTEQCRLCSGSSGQETGTDDDEPIESIDATGEDSDQDNGKIPPRGFTFSSPLASFIFGVLGITCGTAACAGLFFLRARLDRERKLLESINLENNGAKKGYTSVKNGSSSASSLSSKSSASTINSRKKGKSSPAASTSTANSKKSSGSPKKGSPVRRHGSPKKNDRKGKAPAIDQDGSESDNMNRRASLETNATDASGVSELLPRIQRPTDFSYV